jgi:hypothetical protein
MVSAGLAAVADVARVALALVRAEQSRRNLGPRDAVARMRRMGQTGIQRSGVGRRRLRQLIRALDGIYRPNCFRQALAEIALDPAAAAEPLMMGFRRTSRPGSGHAWLASDRQPDRYDVVLSI